MSKKLGRGLARRGMGSPNFLHPLPVLFPLHEFLEMPAMYLHLSANQEKKVRTTVAKVKFEKILTKKIYFNLNLCKYPCFSFAFMHSLVGLLNARVWDGT